MPNARIAVIPLVLAALAACGGAGEHDSPDEGSAAASAPGATLQDSLVTGEAIQTVPPPADDAQPTGAATGDTLHGRDPTSRVP